MFPNARPGMVDGLCGRSIVDGRKLRALTVIDVYTREALCIRVGQRMRGEDVVDACNRLAAQRGAPARIFVDNGSEFSGHLTSTNGQTARTDTISSQPGSTCSGLYPSSPRWPSAIGRLNSPIPCPNGNGAAQRVT